MTSRRVLPMPSEFRAPTDSTAPTCRLVSVVARDVAPFAGRKRHGASACSGCTLRLVFFPPAFCSLTLETSGRHLYSMHSTRTGLHYRTSSRVASPILAFAPVVPVQGVQQLISYVFLNSELHGELAYTSRCHLASCSAHVVHVALQGARRS